MNNDNEDEPHIPPPDLNGPRQDWMEGFRNRVNERVEARRFFIRALEISDEALQTVEVRN